MILSESNFYIYAAKFYENYTCGSTEEFEEDISKFKYLKKLFYIYENKQELRERLILNHLIILYNVFEAKACTKMLLLKMKEYHSYLVPFLLFLGYMPETVTGIYDENYALNVSDVKLDMVIIKRLREIKK